MSRVEKQGLGEVLHGLHGHRKLIFRVLCLLALAWAVAGLLVAHDVREDRSRWLLKVAAENLAQPAGKQDGLPVAENFATQLPVEGSLHAVVEELQEKSRTLRVELSSIQVSETRPTARTLGRQELTLELQGPYTEVKELLRFFADTHPNASVARLALKRVDDLRVVHASVVLHLWFAPLPAPAPATARGV